MIDILLAFVSGLIIGGAIVKLIYDYKIMKNKKREVEDKPGFNSPVEETEETKEPEKRM